VRPGARPGARGWEERRRERRGKESGRGGLTLGLRRPRQPSTGLHLGQRRCNRGGRGVGERWEEVVARETK
jgi:hypothetical protein